MKPKCKGASCHPEKPRISGWNMPTHWWKNNRFSTGFCNKTWGVPPLFKRLAQTNRKRCSSANGSAEIWMVRSTFSNIFPLQLLETSMGISPACQVWLQPHLLRATPAAPLLFLRPPHATWRPTSSPLHQSGGQTNDSRYKQKTRKAKKKLDEWIQ